MSEKIKTYVIVGSSRGLGAALVNEFLNKTTAYVIGISRTKLDDIKNSGQWISTGRYRYIEMDIASPQCRAILRNISKAFSPDPLCVVFNSAHIEKDINATQSINYDAFDNVNRVGIDGFGNILFAFEPHLMEHGGILVGISSFWGEVPPLFLPWIAYPASKAYLNIALRCLRVAWRKHANVIAVNIGNIKNDGAVGLPEWFIPTYSMAAKKIVNSILRKSPPRVINYPFWHSVVYRYILKLVPEFVHSLVFKSYIKLETSRKKDEKQDKKYFKQ